MNQPILHQTAPRAAAVPKPYLVNLYAFVTAIVKADTLENAAKIVINSDYSWDLTCDRYTVAWSVNDCMTVDTTTQDAPTEEDVFEYANLIEPNGFSLTEAQQLRVYEVSFYLNIEVEVDDAIGGADAITKADCADINGELKADFPIDWYVSNAVQSSLIDSRR